MIELAKKFIKDEEGQGLAEYGLILALIAVVVISAVALLGDQIKAAFGKITDELKEPTGVPD
jgi:pilus assembly protein Flp/PilA